MHNFGAHSTSSFMTHDRRKFLNMLGGLGVMIAGPGIAAVSMTVDAQTDALKAQHADDPPWKVTLGEPDGPHPPFISNSRRLLCAPELLDAPDEWIDRSLQWIDYIFCNYPPGLVELPVRRPAIFRLDEILHIASAPQKPLVQQFYQKRLQRVIAETEHTTVTEGTQIWRLYKPRSSNPDSFRLHCIRHSTGDTNARFLAESGVAHTVSGTGRCAVHQPQTP